MCQRDEIAVRFWFSFLFLCLQRKNIVTSQSFKFILQLLSSQEKELKIVRHSFQVNSSNKIGLRTLGLRSHYALKCHITHTHTKCIIFMYVTRVNLVMEYVLEMKTYMLNFLSFTNRYRQSEYSIPKFLCAKFSHSLSKDTPNF